LAPYILILESRPKNLASNIDAAKRTIKAYKATIERNCKIQKMVGTYLACRQKHGMSSTPLINHHPSPQAFNASSKIKELLNVPILMNEKLQHI